MGSSAHRRNPLVAAAFGFALGLAPGCLLELEHNLACGDGVVDLLAGEQCDPQANDSPHLTYCIDKGLGSGDDGKGRALCSDACEIEADKDICAHCGDGKAAGDEQCDGDDLRGATCPSGEGQLGCRSPSSDEPGCSFDLSGCKPCGDGVFSPELEECDFSIKCTADEQCGAGKVCDEAKQTCVLPGEIGLGLACRELVGPNGPYEAGLVTNADCTQDCRYERRRCNYCGNDALDGPYQDYAAPQGTFIQDAEVCDGSFADKEALVDYCQELCTGGPNMTTLQLRCEFSCASSCDGFEHQDWELPVKESARCCVLGGEPCDGPGGFPCCYALDHPEDAEIACLDNTLPKPLCRSG